MKLRRLKINSFELIALYNNCVLIYLNIKKSEAEHKDLQVICFFAQYFVPLVEQPVLPKGFISLIIHKKSLSAQCSKINNSEILVAFQANNKHYCIHRVVLPKPNRNFSQNTVMFEI